MSTARTTRHINLGSLNFQWTARWVDGTLEVTADRPLADLQAAVDAAPLDDADVANAVALRTRAGEALTDLRTIVGSTGSLTNAQLSNAVRALARVNMALIRLAIRRLDGTDE